MIRPLEPEDLQQLPPLWAALHSSARAADLQRIAEDAARGRGNEHQGLALADERNLVRGAVLFRNVAGAVGTGEIEAVAAAEPVLARELMAAAVEKLQLGGARLIVAEYADTPALASYGALLEEAGFTVRARIGDYFGDGVPLVISVRDA
jgi:ribosomal protein S18 acetylase RimI-like enzyme